jgi:hypothetical protein
MKNSSSLCLALTFTTILLGSAQVRAQTPISKVEVGTQVTSLTILNPNGFGDATELGFGARITYNFNRQIAVEAETNLFPHKNVFQGVLGEGRAVQMQFGVKAGQRFRKFGVFGKVRPGLLSVGEVFSAQPGSTTVFFGETLLNSHIGRKTHFTTDVGGVLELYPSERMVVRFDGGDTIVRYGPHFDFDYTNYPQLIRQPAQVKHNFQFSAGVGFRLGQAGSPEPPPPDSSRSRVKATRFEAGVHFTSLSLNHPTTPCSSVCLIGGVQRAIPEPGLGGRFTFNLNDSIALEAESNFFFRNYYYGYYESGHMFQSQFGVKAGKRFGKVGFFGKARPGFVGFTRVNQLIATKLVFIPVLGRQGEIGEFRIGPKKYFSTDVGGVIEFYISRRVLTRMDLGDTIIHYSERDVVGFIASKQIVRLPPETRHNLQFNAGIGFRF